MANNKRRSTRANNDSNKARDLTNNAIIRHNKRKEMTKVVGCRNETRFRKICIAKTDFGALHVVVAVAVAGLAYFLALPILSNSSSNNTTDGPDLAELTSPQQLFQLEENKFHPSSNSKPIEQRFMEEWLVDGSVEIRDEGGITDGLGNRNRGLFATRDIDRGEVIASIVYPDLEQLISQQYPDLRPMVEQALQKAIRLIQPTTTAKSRVTLTTGKVLCLIKFLLEDAKGQASKLYSFIQMIPKNVSNIAWYWTARERQCVVSRPIMEAEGLHVDLEVYHMVMQDLQKWFQPLAKVYNRQTVEWAYLMLKTRGFGQYFYPILDMANHNPRKAVPAFLNPATGKAVFVATHQVKAGEPVYNSYGSLSPVQTAEQYGFVESQPAYFEVPSILEDLLKSERTRGEPLCTKEPVKFFGNVSEQVVAARYGKVGQSTYFKPFMADERSYACIRVLLQTERSEKVAAYVYEKLQFDLSRYRAMIQTPLCQSREGSNFLLIQRANQATAALLHEAMKVAKQGMEARIEYPGIPTYVSNSG